jgi:ribulose kinase
MKMNLWIAGRAAIAALIGAAALASVASQASTPSSPAERAATAELNRNVTARNAAADEHARSLELQYQERMRQFEEQQQRYQALLRSYRNNPDR